MAILLDNHVLIWVVSAPEKLTGAMVETLADEDGDIFFSSVSVWEVAIKFSLKRADFTLDPRRLIRSALSAGLLELPMTSSASAGVATLPHHHRDPFDRLLVSQAIDVGASLLTADTLLAAYGRHVAVS